MRPRSQQVVEKLTGVLGRWDEVVAVGLNSSGEDVYDPYYVLSLDVYTDRPVREEPARELAFGDVGAFESSLLTSKDRFLIGEIPVRLEYKRASRFDELVGAARRGECRLRDAGTYAFHRVVEAAPLLSRDGWLERLREQLDGLPEAFWSQLRRSQQATAEHLYADLSAAAMRDDAFYFSTSSGRFLEQLCALLFTINREFEPSPRSLRQEALALRSIPDSFPANLENFLNETDQLSKSQRRELAELMIRGVFSL